MLQIINKDIFFRCFLQKHEKKVKNQSNEISRGMGVGHNEPRKFVGVGGFQKISFRCGGVDIFWNYTILK